MSEPKKEPSKAIEPSPWVEAIEQNRFVGREFLLWLWHRSEVDETTLVTSTKRTISLWLEAQITLASEGEEAKIKGTAAPAAAEAKQALRRGKLPTSARLFAIVDELEFSWTMKADELWRSGLKIPAELKRDEEQDEALYERMRLVEILEQAMETLFRDFLALRLSPAWERSVVPAMRDWARGKAAKSAAKRPHAAVDRAGDSR